MFGLFAGLIWKGQAYAIPHVVYVELPIPHLLGGFAGLLGWYLIRRGYKNSARQWAVFVAKCLMLTFSILFSFLIGEIGYRAILVAQKNNNSFEKFKADRAAGRAMKVRSSHPMALIIEPVPDRKLVYDLQPNLNMSFGHKRLVTNEDGMRSDRNFSVERLPNSIRILGLGDSGMFGWGVEQGDDYMSVLEKILSGRGDGVTYESLNFGVPGYNTQLESEMLRVKGLKYKPDVVIVGWCVNDFDLPFFMLEEENFRRRDQSFLYTWLFRRPKMTDLVGGFRMTDRREFDVEKVSTNMIAGTAAEGVISAMKSIQQQCDSIGAHLLVFGPMKPEIVKICRDLNIPFFNTLEKIGATEYPAEWAVHFMHPRPEGHRVLAEHLAEELERRGWLRPRP